MSESLIDCRSRVGETTGASASSDNTQTADPAVAALPFRFFLFLNYCFELTPSTTIMSVCKFYIVLSIAINIADQTAVMASLTAYVGTFEGTSPILQYEVDEPHGFLDDDNMEEHAAGIRPSWLALHPNQPFLYSVNENWGPVDGVRSGTVKKHASSPTHLSTKHRT